MIQLLFLVTHFSAHQQQFQIKHTQKSGKRWSCMIETENGCVLYKKKGFYFCIKQLSLGALTIRQKIMSSSVSVDFLRLLVSAFVTVNGNVLENDTVMLWGLIWKLYVTKQKICYKHIKELTPQAHGVAFIYKKKNKNGACRFVCSS